MKRAAELIPVLKRRVDGLSQRIAEAYAGAYPGGDAVKHAGGGGFARDRVGDLVSKAEELKRARRTALIALGRCYRVFDGIPDKRMRELATRHYLEGESWARIARALGYRGEQYPRKALKKYLDGLNAPTDE